MAHRLVFAGIGADLGAIQRHMAQAHQSCLLAEAQHLNKQPGQGTQVAAAEIADPAVVRADSKSVTGVLAGAVSMG